MLERNASIKGKLIISTTFQVSATRFGLNATGCRLSGGLLSLWAPLTVKAASFPPHVASILAAAQRGCSDALISHGGQQRGQHSRTSLQPLLIAGLLIMGFLPNPITAFVWILFNGFSGGWEKKAERRYGISLPERGSRIKSKRANTVERRKEQGRRMRGFRTPNNGN